MNNKIKKGIIGGAIVATTFGSIGVSKEVDKEKFIDQVAKGNLYMTSFNRDFYKDYMVNQIIPKIAKEDFTYEEVRLFLQSCSLEKKEDWILDYNEKLLPQLIKRLDKKLK